MGIEAVNPILDQVREIARLQTVYAEKLARTNAAIPNHMTCTDDERRAYQLLYRASEAACRDVQRAALHLAAVSPALVEALSFHRTDCPYPCCD
jgi:hypothetical protein